MAAMRSSMRSRSTSQNLNDESRRLWLGSSWVVSSSSAFHAAMPWDTCPIFAVPVWTSTFSNVSALVVPLSSTVLPSRDSFPSHPWFAPRCNTGCDRLVAVTRGLNFRDTRRAPLWCAVDCLGARPQLRQILGVECPQGCCNSSPNPYNSFFHGRAEQRDPQLSANKQSRSAHR